MRETVRLFNYPSSNGWSSTLPESLLENKQHHLEAIMTAWLAVSFSGALVPTIRQHGRDNRHGRAHYCMVQHGI